MSETEGFEALTRRVERIERQNRRLRAATATLALSLAALVITAQAPPQSASIEAREFIVRDSNGKQRAKLGADSSATVLSLYDVAEHVRARLIVGDRPGLLMFDPARDGPYAQPRLALGVGSMGGGADDAGPHMLFWDADGQPRVEVYSTKARDGMFIHDARGRTTFRAP